MYFQSLWSISAPQPTKPAAPPRNHWATLAGKPMKVPYLRQPSAVVASKPGGRRPGADRVPDGFYARDAAGPHPDQEEDREGEQGGPQGLEGPVVERHAFPPLTAVR